MDIPDSRIARSKARCPKCKSNTITIIETVECHTVHDQEKGIINFNESENDTEGNVVRAEGICKKCKYSWKFRSLQVTDLLTEEIEDGDEKV